MRCLLFVRLAKQMYIQDGHPTPASIPEQLALLPAVTVTSMSMPPASGRIAAGGRASGGGPLGSAYPSKASAEIHICLPPGKEYIHGVQAIQEHCAKVCGRWECAGGEAIVRWMIERYCSTIRI